MLAGLDLERAGCRTALDAVDPHATGALDRERDHRGLRGACTGERGDDLLRVAHGIELARRIEPVHEHEFLVRLGRTNLELGTSEIERELGIEGDHVERRHHGGELAHPVARVGLGGLEIELVECGVGGGATLAGDLDVLGVLVDEGPGQELIEVALVRRPEPVVELECPIDLVRQAFDLVILGQIDHGHRPPIPLGAGTRAPDCHDGDTDRHSSRHTGPHSLTIGHLARLAHARHAAGSGVWRTPRMDEPLQKSLERYDVLDRIAVGGMAEVFLAKAYGAHGFEKTLAIKRILPELARDPEFEARFIAEAKVAVRLSHANVVQVFDFGRIGESLFIAMEYVDGLDLAQLLRKLKDEKRLLPLPAAFHIAIEIIRALDFAHGHNVVHRDVSPSNILISRAGEVKIGDFGIAVAASPHKSAGAGPRKVMGKWRYMSPEQARGDTLDTRSDMFSAASVLFELFTNEKLFPGDEAEDIIKNIETMPIPRASSVRPGLPSRLDDILAGPLSRKPIDRPTRPATVLRSLIELSYESSIMATALDVAEAVAEVLPAKRISGPGQQLDDVIRKQLGEAKADKSVARRTAVTDGKPPSTATLERGEHSTGHVPQDRHRTAMCAARGRPIDADPRTEAVVPRTSRSRATTRRQS